MFEAELFSFLGNTADAVHVIRDSGEICFWNHSAETLFGFPSEEVLGKTCSAVLHGIGALGTEVCHPRCSPLQCARKGTHIPSFDLNVYSKRRAAMDQRILDSFSQSANEPLASGSLGPRYQ